MMPDIYWPFNKMERCPQLELTPTDNENEAER